MLITSIAEIKRFVAINITLDIVSIEPYIKLAERNYIKPILGTVLYDKLVAEYESSASSSASGILDALLEQTQWALSYLAVWEYVKHVGSAQISDAGITETATGDQKAARKWVNDQVEQSHGATAMQQLDQLLLYLEDNRTDYPDWESSGNFTLYFDCVTNSTKVFEEYYAIGNSRRVFLALKPAIRTAERQAIKPLIGASLYALLLSQVKAASLTPANLALLPYVQEASVYLALQQAIPQLAVKITERGLVLDGSEGTLEQNYTQKPAESMKIGALMRDIGLQVERSVNALTVFLNDNAADYPLYTVPNSDTIDQKDSKGWVF